MATRASEEEVKQIIQTALTEEEISPFLLAANTLVTAVLSDEGYGTVLLKEIERWLAAHLVAIRDPQVKSETIGAVQASYHGQSGLGLNFTPYGQQVMLLDHHGKLAEIQLSKGTAEIKVMME
jgi:hypothetical protein